MRDSNTVVAAQLMAPESLNMDVWLHFRFKMNENSRDVDNGKALGCNDTFYASLSMVVI